MEDPAEIAALATEFITNLDNLPHEVSHIVKEIEHKDLKVQELLPKITQREALLRDLLTKGGSGPANPSGIISEADRVKAEKLAEKIRSEYGRLEEWSVQKEALSKRLWVMVYRQHARLKEEMSKISPALLASASAATSTSLPQLPSVSGLPAVLAGLKSPAAEAETPSGLKRKHPTSTPATSAPSPGTPTASGSGRVRWPNRSTPGADGASTPSPAERGSSALSRGTGRKSGRGGRTSGTSGLSHVVAGAGASGEDGETGAGKEEGETQEGEEAEEKDETLYCFCQRVSFGEMIGCDSDDCKYEWFHIGCVGVSKPLPQTWYCDECLTRLKKRKRT